MTEALVTGAAGFIGSNLSRRLIERDYDVTGVDDLSTGRAQNIEPLMHDSAFDFVETDIRDEQAMHELMQDVDYVFHQAAVPSVPRSVRDPVRSTQANCTGTAVVFQAAREAGVRKVVVASSSSLYGSNQDPPNTESMTPSPESPYALTKYYTEQLAMQFSRLSNIDTVALRYFNIFGPHQDPEGPYAAVIPKFIATMQRGNRPEIYGDGSQTRDFTYISNAVEANILAAEGGLTGEVLNVASGGRVSIDELVDILNEILDASIEPVYEDPRPGDIKHSAADIQKAQRLLNYDPVVGVKEGLRRTVKHYLSG
jgi:nucleoside-diphosphate-sugar epimerase